MRTQVCFYKKTSCFTFIGIPKNNIFIPLRISRVDPGAFSGVEDSLELVDLEGNDLNNVSEAFGELKKLRYLYLPNNNISELSEQVRR